MAFPYFMKTYEIRTNINKHHISGTDESKVKKIKFLLFYHGLFTMNNSIIFFESTIVEWCSKCICSSRRTFSQTASMSSVNKIIHQMNDPFLSTEWSTQYNTIQHNTRWFSHYNRPVLSTDIPLLTSFLTSGIIYGNSATILTINLYSREKVMAETIQFVVWN